MKPQACLGYGTLNIPISMELRVMRFHSKAQEGATYYVQVSLSNDEEDPRLPPRRISRAF